MLYLWIITGCFFVHNLIISIPKIIFKKTHH